MKLIHLTSFSLFALFSPIYDPLTFEEAVEEEVWAQTMDEEIECIEKNHTWELVDVPIDKDVISVKIDLQDKGRC